MSRIDIPKSGVTIKKEEALTRLEEIRNKSNVTNEDLKELLIQVLDKLEGK